VVFSYVKRNFRLVDSHCRHKRGSGPWLRYQASSFEWNSLSRRIAISFRNPQASVPRCLPNAHHPNRCWLRPTHHPPVQIPPLSGLPITPIKDPQRTFYILLLSSMDFTQKTHWRGKQSDPRSPSAVRTYRQISA